MDETGRCTQGEIRLWDVASGEPVGQPLTNHTADVVSLEFSPDGKFLVTASDDTTARIWDANTWKNLYELPGHTSKLHTARFSPDSRYIVTAGEWPDTSARVWDTNTGVLLAVLQGHSGVVKSAAFSPNSRWVVTASEDGTARVWDALPGRWWMC